MKWANYDYEDPSIAKLTSLGVYCWGHCTKRLNDRNICNFAHQGLGEARVHFLPVESNVSVIFLVPSGVSSSSTSKGRSCCLLRTDSAASDFILVLDDVITPRIL